MAGLAWPSGEAAQQGLEAVYEAEDLQRALPEKPVRPEPEASSSCFSRPGAGARDFGRFVAFSIAGVVLAFALVFLLRGYLDRRREVSVAAVEALPTVTAIKLDSAPLADAEALAAKGDFTGAVHALLLRTFASLTEQASLPASLTSREVLGALVLPSAPHAALEQLVSAVELSVFGGEAADREDFERCVAAYRRVLEAV